VSHPVWMPLGVPQAVVGDAVPQGDHEDASRTPAGSWARIMRRQRPMAA